MQDCDPKAYMYMSSGRKDARIGHFSRASTVAPTVTARCQANNRTAQGSQQVHHTTSCVVFADEFAGRLPGEEPAEETYAVGHMRGKNAAERHDPHRRIERKGRQEGK